MYSYVFYCTDVLFLFTPILSLPWSHEFRDRNCVLNYLCFQIHKKLAVKYTVCTLQTGLINGHPKKNTVKKTIPIITHHISYLTIDTWAFSRPNLLCTYTTGTYINLQDGVWGQGSCRTVLRQSVCVSI